MKSAVQRHESQNPRAPSTSIEGDYAYDGSGNITAIGAKQYTYDLLGRLTSFTSDPVHSTSESYEVDRFGNLWRLAHNGVVTEFTGLAPDNRPDAMVVGSATRTLAWDAQGNLERLDLDGGARKEFEFSAEDRLMSSIHDPTPGAPGDETTWLYAYDAAGERVARWRRGPVALLEAGDPPEEVLFTMRDEGGRVLSDWQLIPGGWFTRTRDYLYAGGRLAAQVDWSTGEPESTFVATDHLGSTRALFTSAQDVEEIEYLPYGGFLTGGPVPGSTHLFTGHERDLGEYSSELDYMHARYYSSHLGRFLSVDPVGGEVGLSQSWNRYSYVLNNPAAFVDPSGEEVKLVMEDRDRDQFISELEQKTGFDLDVSDGSMVVRGTLTDAEGNQIGSEAAREILAAFIDAESVFTVEGVNADPNVWGAQHVRGTDTVTLDFTDIAMIQPGANGSSTFDSAMIGLHELVHTVGLRDPGPITLSNYPDATGETVDVMNVVRRQLGLSQRSQYAPVPSSSGRAYIPFEHALSTSRPEPTAGQSR